jgi:uncharacterized repeat protein (TIGR04076 family)
MSVGNFKIIATVKDVKGKCGSGFEVGEKIVIYGGPWGANIDLKETDRICVSGLMPLLLINKAVMSGAKAEDLGLKYVQCYDPGPPLTPGGTVIFEIEVLHE